MKIKFLITILPLLLFLGCGSGGSVESIVDSGDTTVNKTVSLMVKVGYDDSVLARTTNRATKRVKYSDISSIQLTIFDSQKSYIVDTEFNPTPAGGWELEVYELPTNREVTFIAEAFDSNGYRILSGKTVQQLSTETSSVTIPLQLAESEMIVTLPSIETIFGGDANKSRKRLTFNITNPNSEKVFWSITPDAALQNYGEFNQTSGELDFRFKTEIEFSIDFIGDLGNLSFENRMDINSSVGDVTTTFFKIYEQKSSLQVSIAPIVDNIYLTFYEDEVQADAIIDSKLLKSEVCENSFDNLFENFSFTSRSFEELLTQYYNSLDQSSEISGGEIIDIASLLTSLKSEINSSAESNLSKLLNLDINQTYEGLFQSYQTQYGYSDEKFNKIYDYLTDSGFSRMIDYYQNDDKSLVVTLKSFYKDDDNFTSILESYESDFGESNFSNIVEYLISSSESTLLQDYNIDDRNFSQNGEYYYSKFNAEDNSSKERLHILIDKVVDYDFTEFLNLFSESGVRLYILMQFYFNDYSVYDSRFAPLLNFRIDENFDKLYQNLKNIHSENEIFNEFVELVDNRDFIEVLEYYLNPTDQLLNSIKAKLDRDVCITENFGLIDYEWRLANSSLEIENPYINPIKIIGFNGTLQDKLSLTARNSDGVTSEFSYEINVKNWFDENNRSITIEPTDPTDPNVTNPDDPDNPDVTDPDDPNSGTDYGFTLYKDKNEMEILYGETSSITFTTSKVFDDFSYDILGVVNPSLFEYQVYNVSTTAITKYQLDITAKETTGTGSLNFIVQNQYHSEAETISITVSNPIQALDIKPVYTVLEGNEFNISVRFANPRGDTLQFSLIESSSILDAWRSGDSLFDGGQSETGVTYNFMVKGLSEGEDEITLRVTDTTMEPDFYVDYPITIKVEPLDETAINDELAKYSCGDLQLNSSHYIYIDDAYGDGSTPSPDNAVEVESMNSIYGDGDYLSRVVVLYPTGEIYTNSDYGEFYIYNQSSMKYIGSLKYAPTLNEKEFYLKYYDNITNSVVCEKHKFSPLGGI